MTDGYRYETHCHCNRCSRCAHSTPAELVRAYAAAGFSGLVLTDHFIHGYTCVDPQLPWRQRMECYYNAYLEAKAAARGLDFDVIFGLEHAYGDGYEVLCYGIDLDFLLNNPDIPELSPAAFSERVHAYGGIVIQAHPYRYSDSHHWLDPAIIDGVEVHNAGLTPERNAFARRAAEGTDLILTSGGDIHRADDSRIGTAGVILDRRVPDSKEFAAALRRRSHQLLP